jgi:putative alpha-1,2-mannosidase
MKGKPMTSENDSTDAGPETAAVDQQLIVQVPLEDHVSGAWHKWRKVVEANMATATVEQKSHYNVWDHIKDVCAVLSMVSDGSWVWFRNTQCKYIDVRIDMRTGNCIIKNNDGNRINPSDLTYQYQPPK